MDQAPSEARRLGRLRHAHLAKAIVGMKQLAKNGLRYPIAPYGIQSDVRAGMGASYGKK